MSTENELVEVFLVPGFLGFESLGGLDYFIDVEDLVKQKLSAPGITVNVYPTEPKPAASLYRRAARLAEEVADHHSMDATSVHFVGHSTGGLDIRLLLSPENAVERELKKKAGGDERARSVLDAIQKTRSATSVATPHFGSPIASLALRLDADLIVRRLSKALERPGLSVFLAKVLDLAGLATSLFSGLPRGESFYDWITGDVLSGPPEKIVEYVQHVAADTGALRNLTQEGADLANALLIDRPEVRYGSIITGTPKPGWFVKTDDPLLLLNTAIYGRVWRIVAKENPNYPYSPLSQDISRIHADDFESGYDVGKLQIDEDTSDGVVPTASQAYGTILGVFASDHLDCVGHFPHRRSDGKQVTGWVRSGAAFDGDRFELLWARVCDFIAARQEVRSAPHQTAMPASARKL